MADLLTFGAQTLTSKIKGQPVKLDTDALDADIISIKVPGYDRETTTFTPEGITAMAELMEAEPVAGSQPHEVAMRTRSYDPDGGMTCRFSDAERSRTLTLTAEDRAEFAGLMRAIEAKWNEVIAKREAASAEPEVTEGD